MRNSKYTKEFKDTIVQLVVNGDGTKVIRRLIKSIIGITLYFTEIQLY